MPKLGEKVDLESAIQGPPPVVLAVQPTGYFVIEKHEDLSHWEHDLQHFLGVSVRNKGGMVGSASESCSGGCSDDCDMM